MNTRLLLLALLFCSLSLCVVGDCGFGGFDFSGLTKSGSTADFTGTDSGGYVYHVNVCGASTVSDSNCNSAKGIICQYTTNNAFVAVVAKWTGSGTWGYVDANNATAGIKLSFANGDPCFPTMNARTAQINFVCGSAESGTITVTEASCNYVLTFPTTHACAGGGGGGNPDDSGLSGGWIFIIVLLVVIPIYIVGGCIYNHRKTPESSFMGKCPNSEFWFNFPGLVKDGCLYTFAGLKNCVGRCTGKGGYNTMA